MRRPRRSTLFPYTTLFRSRAGVSIGAGGLGWAAIRAGWCGEAGVLALAGGEDAGADLGGTFRGCGGAQLLILNGGHLYMYVDAVEQGSADLADVALDHGRGAHALAGLVVEVAAGSRVHGGGEHEGRGAAGPQ